MSDGLSIRPQTLHLSPSYRRLRDSLLRPQLRLTESRYFWERWKARLGPDATVLIMEVRDRCNRALSTQLGHSAAGHSGPAWSTETSRTEAAAPPLSDLPNTGDEGETSGEGCTVSAGELAAACGFSRVTLWRILQREDVRRFISIEHNYVYDRRLGKKRRTVSTYHVQMEDPLVEEDERRLLQLLEAHGTASDGDVQGTARGTPARSGGAGTAWGLATSRRPGAGALPGYPPPTVQTETEVVDSPRPMLQSETTTSGSIPKPQNVPQTIVKKRLPENAATLSHGNRPEVDMWKKYPELAHYVEEAETLLGDSHSRGFYLKALKQLYPTYMDLWQRALGLAREQQRIRVSRGALFTRLVRTFAAEAGVTL